MARIQFLMPATSRRILSRAIKKLADHYGFYILVLDFSSTPLEVLISHNKQRLQYNRGLQYVPEQVIRNIYQKMEPVPKGIYTINATQPDAEEKFWNIYG